MYLTLEKISWNPTKEKKNFVFPKDRLNKSGKFKNLTALYYNF
jgi:hypothetical protein